MKTSFSYLHPSVVSLCVRRKNIFPVLVNIETIESVLNALSFSQTTCPKVSPISSNIAQYTIPINTNIIREFFLEKEIDREMMLTSNIPNEFAAMRTERRLSQERCHKFVSVHLWMDKIYFRLDYCKWNAYDQFPLWHIGVTAIYLMNTTTHCTAAAIECGSLFELGGGCHFDWCSRSRRLRLFYTRYNKMIVKQ